MALWIHVNIDLEFPKETELYKHKLVKNQMEKQMQFSKNIMKHPVTVMLKTYQLARNIARAKKPYNEGEFFFFF